MEDGVIVQYEIRLWSQNPVELHENSFATQDEMISWIHEMGRQYGECRFSTRVVYQRYEYSAWSKFAKDDPFRDVMFQHAYKSLIDQMINRKDDRDGYIIKGFQTL